MKKELGEQIQSQNERMLWAASEAVDDFAGEYGSYFQGFPEVAGYMLLRLSIDLYISQYEAQLKRVNGECLSEEEIKIRASYIRTYESCTKFRDLYGTFFKTIAGIRGIVNFPGSDLRAQLEVAKAASEGLDIWVEGQKEDKYNTNYKSV